MINRPEGFFYIIFLCVSVVFFTNCASGNEKEVNKKLGKKEISKRVLFYDEQISALRRMEPVLPIKDAHITTFDGQLPNAPRKYRGGSHEGFDFYNGFCGVRIEKSTPVLAVADGKVVRADTNYTEIKPERREMLLKEAHSLGFTPDSTLDILRGRQVWLDHGSGIVSRYCHLSAIPAGLKGKVKKGNIVGFVGGSGTKSKVPHLHFEIRLGKDFFGKDKTPSEIREIMKEIFYFQQGF